MKFETDFFLENSEWPAFLVDASGTIRSANRAAVATFGAVLEGQNSQLPLMWPKENEMTFEQFSTRVDRAQTLVVPLKFHVKGGALVTFKSFICSQSKEGQKYLLFQLFRESLAPPHPTSAPAVAATQERPLESVTAQRQKLECALQLTRSVALDFNNALTSILGHTSLILAKMPPTHTWRASLVEVEKSAQKAAEIANDLASFSRPQKDVRGNLPGNLNQVLRRTVELYQVPGIHKVHWTLQLESKLYTANFDEAKMQQAFMKILDNAIQAPGENRQIRVTTRNESFTEPTLKGTSMLSAGDYVHVEISDTGGGIPADVLPRIFEPFFTTKSGHRGLGLAWVYGIVTNHGGTVTVTSKGGQGTTVGLYLPARKKIVKSEEFQDDNLGGDQTLLMVDDEDLLLTMGQMILSSFGYRVLTANSGQRALEVFGKSESPIDLVITDLVMPNMSGRELIENLRRLSPEVRVICTSGYVRASSAEEEGHYLQKPFTSQELLRKVKEVLA